TPDNDIGKNSFNYIQVNNFYLSSSLYLEGENPSPMAALLPPYSCSKPSISLIRSAFGMALSNLSNPKNILALGPNRSILGTIIRPDPVLLERKGGPSGDVTFSNLLPGAGEPLQTLNGEKQDILCNWQFDDEEPLPRGNGNAGDVSAQSSGRKRKSSSKGRHRKKKIKENVDVTKDWDEETFSKKEKSSRKKSSRHSHKHKDSNGYGYHHGGASWSR
ncbi:hypothetical protein Goari_017559, partial [Gossypium aridum]|nr:hypothetical protein [Gossypium aridum]